MRRLLVAVVVSSATLLLSTCAYLFDSPFPAYLTLEVDRADISGLIPYVDSGYYEIRVLDGPSGDRVWLYADVTESGDRTEKFVLFDEELDKLLEKEDDGDLFDGQGLVMTDPTGFFYIGRLTFNASLALQSTVSWADSKPNYGYWDPFGSQFRFMEIFTPDSIQYRPAANYTVDPFAGSAGAGNIGTGLTYNGVEAVAHNITGGRAALYFLPDSRDRVEGIIQSDVDFAENIVITSVSTRPGYFSIPLDSELDRRPQFVGDGTVVISRTDNREKMALYDIAGQEVETYIVPDRGETEYGYSPNGKYWYIMDVPAGALIKARTWW